MTSPKGRFRIPGQPPIPARSGANPRLKRRFLPALCHSARPIGRETGLRGSQRPVQRDSALPGPSPRRKPACRAPAAILASSRAAFGLAAGRRLPPGRHHVRAAAIRRCPGPRPGPVCPCPPLPPWALWRAPPCWEGEGGRGAASRCRPPSASPAEAPVAGRCGPGQASPGAAPAGTTLRLAASRRRSWCRHAPPSIGLRAARDRAAALNPAARSAPRACFRRSRHPPGRAVPAPIPDVLGRSVRPPLVAVAANRSRHDYPFAACARECVPVR